MSPLNLTLASLRHPATLCMAFCLVTCVSLAYAGTANSGNTQPGKLGRLFFTPEQRQQLDYAYARNAAAEGNSSAVLTVNGIVQKNGGARTVWVNGVSQNASNNSEHNPTVQTVTVPGKANPVKLKVGQKLLLDQPALSPRNSAAE